MSDPLGTAILNTLTYADLFDYPLTPNEVYRYLIGVRASREEVEQAIYDPTRLDGSVARVDGFITLPKRQAAVESRSYWQTLSLGLWQRARFYVQILSHFPFVRMVAVSGGLSMNNARDNDIDLFIITAPRRLWLTRACTILLVRLARWRGDHLCPNFLLAENSLALDEQNLYAAHEVVQLVPLYGYNLFNKMREQNPWVESFLPNADVTKTNGPEIQIGAIGKLVKSSVEHLLGGLIGNVMEAWEMKRKITKLSAQIPSSADQVIFSANMCRGFLSGHRRRVLTEYQARITNHHLPITFE